MIFDGIIMNPPYGDRYHPYLHNEIYVEASKHKTTSGICVSLMPVGKLQTPRLLTKSQLFETKNITSKIEVIDNNRAEKIFNIALAENLGIYIADSTKTSYIDWKLFAYKSNNIFKNICEKIYAYTKLLNKYTADSAKNFSYRLSLNHGHPGNKDEYDLSTKREDLVFSTIKSSQCTFFNFETEVERTNFKHYMELVPMKFLRFIERNSLHIFLQMYPWLGEAKNPRTGLYGYESEWTDEDFYTFFNITKEEQKIIEETMKPYK